LLFADVVEGVDADDVGDVVVESGGVVAGD
jgi:hypothetical protein